MNEIIVKRATNKHQKEARRDAILVAARALFMEAGFFDVNMATIAKRSGLAKGTVYLYFKTKEEIFLTLSTEEFENWLSEFDQALGKAGADLEIPDFLEILMGTLRERKVMQRLQPLLHLVLEKNISYDQAFAFKQNLKERSEGTSRLVEHALPFLAEGQGIAVLTLLHCLVVGWGQMSDPSPVLAEVLEHPEMSPFRFDFENNLKESMTYTLLGMKCAAE